MMQHEDVHALVDGELDGDSQAAVVERIGRCSATRAEYETALLIKKVVREKTAPFECSAAWSKCRARLDELDKTRRAEHFVGKYAWAICSVFLLFIVGAGLFNRMDGRKSLYAGDVSAMISGLSPVSIEPKGIQDWISNKMGRNLVSIAPNDAITVRSAAMGQFDGRRFVRLDLQDSHGSMALLVVSNTHEIVGARPARERSFSQSQIEAYNCVSWVQDGNAMLLVGDRTSAELTSIAERIRSARR